MKRLKLIGAGAAIWLPLSSGSALGSKAWEATTRFFETHPNPIDVREEGDEIAMANRRVGLAFTRSDSGFELTRLYGIAENRDYLTRPAPGEPRNLFELRMALDPKIVGKDERQMKKSGGIQAIERMAEMGQAFTIGSQAAARTAWRVEAAEDETVLHLEWKGIDVREAKGAVDVAVTVALRPDDALSRWRVSVSNESLRDGIERVRIPLLPLAPVGQAADNVLVYPKWRGGYLEDPFHAPAGIGENYHTTGAYYPYYVNMQWWALYNKEDREGLYFGTQDPTPNMMHCRLENKPDEMVWSVAHFPPNISYAAENYTQPYDAVVGPFQGDWYDAAQQYRAWATNQTWCARGPLSEREDIPVWYKETPLYFYAQLSDSAEGTHSVAENLPIAADHFSEWLAWAGVRMPANFYTWEQHDPRRISFAYETPFSAHRLPNANSNRKRWAGLKHAHNSYDGNYPAVPALEDFADTCRRLRGEGGMVCPYVCIQLFNQGPLDNAPYAAEARYHMAREAYGSLMGWIGLGEWFPCVNTEWWRNRMVETCTTLLEREQVGGFYLDVMHGMGVAPCFWTPHGHSSGGGSSGTLGLHELTRRIRDAVKAIDPEAIATGEAPTENMIDVIDGMLYQRTLRPENQVPLLAAVYQDFIPRYGLELSADPGYEGRYEEVWREDAFFIECASLFVEGAQVGRLRLRPRDISLELDNPAHREMIEFLGRIVGYYKQDQAKQFLVYGRLLRPLAFSAPSPMPRLAYTSYDVRQETSFPALMSGVFRSPGGDIGVFVVNAGAEDRTFRAPLDRADCGLPESAAVTVQAVPPAGESRRIAESVRGPIVLEGRLPGRGLTFFSITGRAASTMGTGPIQ